MVKEILMSSLRQTVGCTCRMCGFNIDRQTIDIEVNPKCPIHYSQSKLKTLPKVEGKSFGMRIAVCDGCEKRSPIMVMLKDELWLRICDHKRQFLCFDCMEKRLGRTICFSDLKDCKITEQFMFGAALIQRCGMQINLEALRD